MANHKYYAELGINAAEAVKGFGEAEKGAASLTNTMTALGTALDGVNTKTGDTKDLTNTLKLYQQLATAAGSYGRAMKTLADPAVAKGATQMSAAMKSMNTELQRIKKDESAEYGKKTTKTLSNTLDLYKQLAQAAGTYTGSLKNEAAAIKLVADAEARRNQVSQAGANAGTRGGDIWGVTKDERDDRKRAQTVIQAEKEMEAAFNSRAEAVMKANRDQESAVRRNTGLQGNAANEMDRSSRSAQGFASSVNAGNAQLFQSEAAFAAQEKGLASTRYALYEVAATYAAVSAAAAALPVAGARAAIDMQQQFAHVARTTQAADAPLASLKNRFQDLSTEIPVTFEELSKIGTLGAQMGIATGDLESFADTVAKFSATTNVTVDQAAMSFGRLSNMMHLTEGDYRNLGASISELGTASVATESEILAIAEAVATTANMAGFSADQVVGLSTAMASLRIRPEMARGAMQRIFAQINAAVADGTEKFDSYAAAMGMSAQAADSLWRSDPSEFFQRIAKSIGEMDDNVERSQFIREGLGLRNVRDIELLNRLSNGYEVYADSMSLANDAYARGDYLEKEAGVIFDTTAAALERLGSAFTAMIASFGDDSLGPVKAIADILIGLMNAIRDMPSWAKNSSSAILLIVAGLAGLRAAMALAMASMRAFRLVNQNLGIAGAVSMRALGNEARLTFGGITAGAAAAKVAVQSFLFDLKMAPSIMGRARVAMAGLTSAFYAMGPIGWITAIATLGAAIWGLANAHESAADKARAHGEALTEAAGGADKLREAVALDAQELADGIQTKPLYELKVEAEGTADAMDRLTDHTAVYVHGMGAMPTPVSRGTKALEEQTIAIGAHTDALIRSALVEFKPAEIVDMESIQEALSRGFSPARLLDIYYKQGDAAAQAYIDGFIESNHNVQGWGDKQAEDLTNYFSAAAGGILNAVTDAVVGSDVKNIMNNALGLPELSDGLDEVADSADTAASAFGDFVGEMFGLLDTEMAVNAALDRLGEALDKNGASFSTMTAEGRDNMAALRGLIDSVAKDIQAQMDAGAMTAAEGAHSFAAYIESLMGELAAMGVDTSEFEAFRAQLDTIFADPLAVGVDIDPAVTALGALQTYAQGVFDSLNAQSNVSRGMAASGARYSGQAFAQGVGAPGKLARHQSNIAAQRARSAAAQAQRTSSAYGDGRSAAAAHARAEQERLNKELEKGKKSVKDTSDQAAKLRKEIEDINDPARIFEETMKELSSAFKDTLHDFNNLQSSRDSMESHLTGMRDAAQSAKDEVRDLREEAAKLRREASEERVTAQQSRIFAGVAARYGDSARQNQYTVEAEGAEAAAKEKERLAKAAATEAAEIDKNRLSLTGYSKQAIENRNSVRGLQQEMSDLIIAYAETGASTQDVERYAERLRRKFIDQVTQMGYNRRDVERLSTVFVNLKRDIDRVPREVRTRARADTAEAQKKIRDLAKDQTVNVKFKSAGGNITATGNLLVKEVRANEAKFVKVTQGGGAHMNIMAARGGVIPGSSSGKYTDNMLATGHKYDGTVSVRSGEGIVSEPALKRMGGAPWLNAVNSMSAPPPTVIVSGGGGGAAGGNGVVDLSPRSVQLLARQVSTILAVDGREIARTANNVNTATARRGNG